MIAAAAILAMAVWVLLYALSPTPETNVHAVPTSSVPAISIPGPSDAARPLIVLQQFGADGRRLSFGAIAATDQVELRIIGAGASTGVTLLVRRDGAPAGEVLPEPIGGGIFAHRLLDLAPGVYSWSARIVAADTSETHDYPAPAPSFVIAGSSHREIHLGQSNHLGQPLPRGEPSLGGFNAEVWSDGGFVEADVEVKPVGKPFTGAGIVTIQIVEGRSRIWLPLSPNRYIWRARLRSGEASEPWVAFSDATVPDVEVVTELPQETSTRGQDQNRDRNLGTGTGQSSQDRQPAPGAGISSGSSGIGDDDDGNGGGRSTPRPSEVVAPPTLWSLLTPTSAAIAVAIAGLAMAAMAIYVRWRAR